MRAGRALAVAVALLVTVNDAGAITNGHVERQLRRRNHEPPLPFPEVLHPPDQPLLPSGFVMTVVKADTRKPAVAEPLAHPRDVAERLAECWSPPSLPGNSVAEVTIRAQFSRFGAVIGQPRVSYVKAGGAMEGRAALASSIRAALADCAPLRFTDPLGAAIAGYPFAIRFIAGGQNSRVQP